MMKKVIIQCDGLAMCKLTSLKESPNDVQMIDVENLIYLSILFNK